jgi:hypothetical protein
MVFFESYWILLEIIVIFLHSEIQHILYDGLVNKFNSQKNAREFIFSTSGKK